MLDADELTSRQKTNRYYHISTYGRFGYTVTFFAGIPFCGGIIIPFASPAPDISLGGMFFSFLLGKRLDHSSQIGFVSLFIGLNSVFRRKKFVRLDVSGLSPNYKTLFEDIKTRLSMHSYGANAS